LRHDKVCLQFSSDTFIFYSPLFPPTYFRVSGTTQTPIIYISGSNNTGPVINNKQFTMYINDFRNQLAIQLRPRPHPKKVNVIGPVHTRIGQPLQKTTYWPIVIGSQSMQTDGRGSIQMLAVLTFIPTRYQGHHDIDFEAFQSPMSLHYSLV